METLKTAAIVVLLLAVLYGVYLVLNKPDPSPPGDLAWETGATAPLQVDLGESGSDASVATGDSSATTPQRVEMPPTSAVPETVPAPDFVDEPAPSETIEPPADPARTADASPNDHSPETDRPDWRSEADWSSVTPPEAPPTETLVENGGDRASPATESEYPTGPNSSSWQTEEEATVPETAVTQDVAPPTAAGSQGEQPSVGSSVVESALQSAKAKIADEQWYDALLTLSIVYGSHDASEDGNRRLLELLDPLAGKVIYSDEHLIDAPYEVARGDTLAHIADRYQVPWQLLANVNGIESPELLEPGTKLKVIRGPFRAEIDLRRNELAVFAGRLYAGRFPITVGGDPEPQEGDFRVYDKQPGRTYYAGDGRTVPADDASNPYGSIWIDLGGDLCIHGSSESAPPGQGCISLSPIDANDVYGILSKGSTVTILR
ncbi:MAG: LysM peptidoglycan-binding domain-containing protein [Pirellulaceae bacterium]